MTCKKLDREYFKDHALLVAPKLLGLVIVNQAKSLIITEVEAYGGFDDQASHAYRGISKRNRSMFCQPGTLYVYLSYGIHCCINVVTDRVGTGGAVLIRGGIAFEGDLREGWEGLLPFTVSGPGRVGRFLDVGLDDDGLDLLDSDRFRIVDLGFEFGTFTLPNSTERVGISKAADLPWRFIIDNQQAIELLSDQAKLSGLKL